MVCTIDKMGVRVRQTGDGGKGEREAASVSVYTIFKKGVRVRRKEMEG